MVRAAEVGAGEVGAGTLHRVIAWKDVGETEGTGIVHIAPGCGKEDFQLGKEQGLPPVAPLDEYGVFLPGFGALDRQVGRRSRDDRLDPRPTCSRRACCFAVEKYPHSYPHCWRCKTELLFRLVDEWFINMTWRDEIMDVVEQVTLPAGVDQRPGPRAGLADATWATG